MITIPLFFFLLRVSGCFWLKWCHDPPNIFFHHLGKWKIVFCLRFAGCRMPLYYIYVMKSISSHCKINNMSFRIKCKLYVTIENPLWEPSTGYKDWSFFIPLYGGIITFSHSSCFCGTLQSHRSESCSRSQCTSFQTVLQKRLTGRKHMSWTPNLNLRTCEASQRPSKS